MSDHIMRHAARFVLLAAMTGAAACSAKKSAANVAADSTTADQRPLTLSPDQREHLRVIPVTVESYRPTISTTGTVAFDGNISTQVLAPISGPVLRLLVEVGAQVNRGDPLAAISSPDFAAAVSAYRKAQAAALQTKRIADLNAELFKADGIAKRDLEQSEEDAEAAESDRDAALQQLRALGVDSITIAALQDPKKSVPVQAYIRAPIAGTVVEKLITPGQLLQAGATPCFTVADLSRMWVLANVFESDLAFVSPGDKAQITGAALPHPLSGVAIYVAALVDPSTRATSVRIEVPQHRARAAEGHVCRSGDPVVAHDQGNAHSRLRRAAR